MYILTLNIKINPKSNLILQCKSLFPHFISSYNRNNFTVFYYASIAFELIMANEIQFFTFYSHFFFVKTSFKLIFYFIVLTLNYLV